MFVKGKFLFLKSGQHVSSFQDGVPSGIRSFLLLKEAAMVGQIQNPYGGPVAERSPQLDISQVSKKR